MVRVARIEPDPVPESPRGWDNLGTMACWHRRYDLGDEQPSETPHEYRRGKRIVVELPLYLYDHSGITMSTGNEYPFNCPWDAGQVGIIYVTRERLIAEYGACNAETKAKAAEVLRAEVDTYDQYLQGDVWGFTLEEDGEFVDGCWGFYGPNPKSNGMIDHMPDDSWRALLIEAGNADMDNGACREATTAGYES